MTNVNIITEKAGAIYRGRRWFQTQMARLLPAEFVTQLYYAIAMKKRLDIKHPRTFNEKMQWYKLYYCPLQPLVAQCADKYRVRKYVEAKGYSDTLVPLIGVWDSLEEVNWKELPNKFAMKCTHGCGYNIICGDKSSLDLRRVERLLCRWMKEDFGLFNIEPHYSKIKPKIICEEYIETLAAPLPIDYKIYYFDGVAKAILVCTERAGVGQKVFYDTDWNVMDITRNHPAETQARPRLMDQALKIGSDLAQDFPFVRIDFYDCEGQIIFGEMTFTAGAGLSKVASEEGDAWLGECFNLPGAYK